MFFFEEKKLLILNENELYISQMEKHIVLAGINWYIKNIWKVSGRFDFKRIRMNN